MLKYLIWRQSICFGPSFLKPGIFFYRIHWSIRKTLQNLLNVQFTPTNRKRYSIFGIKWLFWLLIQWLIRQQKMINGTHSSWFWAKSFYSTGLLRSANMKNTVEAIIARSSPNLNTNCSTIKMHVDGTHRRSSGGYSDSKSHILKFNNFAKIKPRKIPVPMIFGILVNSPERVTEKPEKCIFIRFVAPQFSVSLMAILEITFASRIKT